MIAPDPFAALRRAVGPGAPSSDYDLTPALRPAGRALRGAAVLVAFEDAPGGLRLYLTKRSSHLKHHPGQIAFPGGKIDAGDVDAVAAALREAEEEIGLPPGAVEVLGSLPAHETVTAFSVTPVLARIVRPFEPVAEAGEVDEVFTVPYGPYYIWGATARILRALAGRIGE